MERDRVTLFAGVPTMYFALLHHESPRAHDLSRAQVLHVRRRGDAGRGDARLRGEVRVEILEGYGLSETSPVASFNMLDRPRKPGSIGYPVWGVEMCILDEQRRSRSADGEPGEICIRGHNVMKGYWKRPEATRRRCAAAGSTPATSASATRTATTSSSTARRT